VLLVLQFPAPIWGVMKKAGGIKMSYLAKLRFFLN